MKVCADKTGRDGGARGERSPTPSSRRPSARMSRRTGKDDASGVRRGRRLRGHHLAGTSRPPGCVGPCAPLDKKTLPGAIADVSRRQRRVPPRGSCARCRNDTSRSRCSSRLQTPRSTAAAAARTAGTAAQGSGAQQQSAAVLPPVRHHVRRSPAGETRLRVTTTTRRWTEGANVNDVAAGFDQEAGAALVAQSAHVEDGDGGRVRLPRRDQVARPVRSSACASGSGTTARTTRRRSSSCPSSPSTPSSCSTCVRSQFVQVFNNSPDETAYYRMILWRENVSELAGHDPAHADGVLVQRAPRAGAARRVLHRAGPHPRPGRVLLRRRLPRADHRAVAQGQLPGPARASRRVQAAPRGAEGGRARRCLGKQRFPAPRLVDCDQHGSAGALLARQAQPQSATYNSGGAVRRRRAGTSSSPDDVSLQVFMEHLKRLAVAS